MSNQAITTEPTLEPCPFCGTAPRLITIPGFEPRCYVMCSLGCGACGAEFNSKDAADRATTSWNSRVSVPSIAPVGEGIRKLTIPELNHLSVLLEAERESGSYTGPRSQYYARTERLIKWCHEQTEGKS